MEEEETHNAILLQIQKQTQIHTQTQLQKRKVVAPLEKDNTRPAITTNDSSDEWQPHATHTNKNVKG